MIVPSIDLMGGQAVQLVGGVEKVLDAGDPRPILERFAVAGEVAVVDLDAALGRGDNRELIRELVRTAPCRVGGGIRDVASARRWLDEGAERVVLGTAAREEVLNELPAERVVVALDARDGRVQVEGWTRDAGFGVMERMARLRDHCGGFLVTAIEREGRLAGVDLERAAQWIEAAGGRAVTVAGGVRDAGEVAALDRLGADAQVGMALYQGRLDLADALMAPLTSDRADGRWPTIVRDVSGPVLGLVWSDAESVRAAVRERRGVYSSRQRGLWRKGETSGAIQELVRIEVDCDRDALQFVVRQRGGGFCHRGTFSCFGADRGLSALARTIAERSEHAVVGSYTARLLADRELLGAKLWEEAGELVCAKDRAEVVHEAADLLYFTLVRLQQAGVTLDEVEHELDRRARTQTRRGGERKVVSPGTNG